MARSRLYHLLQLAAQRARKHADEAGIAAAGVSAAQGGAMFVIAGAPGVSQRELARSLGQQESAVTTMVARLMAAGFVDRAPHAGEVRSWSLTLTDKGAQALERLRLELEEINRRFEAVLGADELDLLADALDRLARIRWTG